MSADNKHNCTRALRAIVRNLRAPELIALILIAAIPAMNWAQQPSTLRVTTVDVDGNPLPEVKISVRLDGRELFSATSDAQGAARISAISPGTYEVVAVKKGFQPNRQTVSLSAEGLVLEFTLLPKIVRSENVEVRADAVGSGPQTATSSTTLQTDQIKSLPDRPATVTDALPLVPGVTRSPDGEIVIAGGGEHKSAFVVNGTDVTDPATGRFGLTVPVDSVESIDVMKTPFLAEYGRFTSGVVSVETRRGGEKWHFELNDPLPSFRIRSGHLSGLRDATPRINFGGPVLRDKFYFAEGFEYTVRKVAVRTLPYPYNESKSESINSFSQSDYILSPKHFLTVTSQVAQEHSNFNNLSFFTPQPVSPSLRVSERLFAVTDHLAYGATLLSSTFSFQNFGAGVGAQGNAPMTLTPTGDLGNYYRRVLRDSSRLQWIEAASRSFKTAMGVNDVKFGFDVAHTNEFVRNTARPIIIRDTGGQLLKQIDFVGGSPYSQSDTELAVYGQDHWLIAPRFALDFGARLESQTGTQTQRFAPRVGVAWTPFQRLSTVLRGGFGIYYDRVPLNVFSFFQRPQQVITTYGPGGVIVDGPHRYRNLIEGVTGRRFSLVAGRQIASNFAPYSETWNIELEQSISPRVRLRVNYLDSVSGGIITISPRTARGPYAYVLAGNGQSSYRQLEFTSKVRWSKGQELILSYVRSRSRGNLNEFNRFLGDFPSPVVPDDRISLRPEDLPNRFLAWGSLSLPSRFSIYPIFEYRTGAPYALLDPMRNYVGIPYTARYPNFFSADARIAKDIPYRHKYTLRFSVSGFNLTNHFNALEAHTNTDDPLLGVFFGNYRRRFRADFDFLF